MKLHCFRLALAALLLLLIGHSSVSGQGVTPGKASTTVTLGTAFTYQGSLSTTSGPVNGACDLRFGLFDSASGGNQLGTVTRSSTTVTSGLFVVTLDFGADAFNGQERFLETEVRCPAGSGVYTTLLPRQQVAPTPYALVAESANSSRTDFTVNGQLWVQGAGIFGGPSTMGAISLRSPDLWIQADDSFNRGDGGRALAHTANDTLNINHAGDFAGGVVIGSNTRVEGRLDVNGAATFGAPGPLTAAITLRAPDVYLTADSSFGRGDGGRALVHAGSDTLIINHAGDFGGGVRIESEARIEGTLTVMGDLSAEGNTIRLIGTDFYMNGGADRGDGGRALVHDRQDTLVVNYDRDFSGGVRINDLRTGAIVEENLMTPAQREDFSLLPFTQGDVLCWDGDRQELTRCASFASPLVVGVADDQGKPIVLGAEPVKVIGAVQPGDLLVSSDVAGYATAWSRVKPGSPPTGVVIAKALQRFEGEKGIVKAMIFLQ